MLMIGALWRSLGLPVDGLIHAVEKRFASKPVLLALDIALIRHGYELKDAILQNKTRHCELSEPAEESVAIQGNGSPRHFVPRDDCEKMLSHFHLSTTTNTLTEHKLLD
jgi:hypothetical protein